MIRALFPHVLPISFGNPIGSSFSSLMLLPLFLGVFLYSFHLLFWRLPLLVCFHVKSGFYGLNQRFHLKTWSPSATSSRSIPRSSTTTSSSSQCPSDSGARSTQKGSTTHASFGLFSCRRRQSKTVLLRKSTQDLNRCPKEPTASC